MRYIARQLVWRKEPLSDVWMDHEGGSLDTHFSFGGNHVWQAPAGGLRTFASMEYCIQQARAWIQREPFQTLITDDGGIAWSSLLSELLGVTVPCCQRPTRCTLHLNGPDLVLRLALPAVLQDAPPTTIVSTLRKHPELCRWYLHCLRPYQRVAHVHYDAGL